MHVNRSRSAVIALALAVLLAGCAGTPGESTAPSTPPTMPSASPTASDATPAPTTASPDVTVAPPAPEPSAWSGPQEIDVSEWQAFTMPGGEASFRLPSTWEVRDVRPFSAGTSGSSGTAHVYTDGGEHLLGLTLANEPWTFDCSESSFDSHVLLADPLDLGVSTPSGSEIATEVRFDAIGVVGAVTMSMADGQTGDGTCAPDNAVALTPGANGIVAVAFGTGDPGPSLIAAPSFSGFSSASRAIELVDQELLATAWQIVRSLEVTP